MLPAIKQTDIAIHEGDEPDSAPDLSQAADLAGEDLAEIDFLFYDAETTAARGPHGAVVEQAVGLGFFRAFMMSGINDKDDPIRGWDRVFQASRLSMVRHARCCQCRLLYGFAERGVRVNRRGQVFDPQAGFNGQ